MCNYVRKIFQYALIEFNHKKITAQQQQQQRNLPQLGWCDGMGCNGSNERECGLQRAFVVFKQRVKLCSECIRLSTILIANETSEVCKIISGWLDSRTETRKVLLLAMEWIKLGKHLDTLNCCGALRRSFFFFFFFSIWLSLLFGRHFLVVRLWINKSIIRCIVVPYPGSSVLVLSIPTHTLCHLHHRLTASSRWQ